MRSEALRLSQKYVDLLTNIFKHTGNLWEKYNVVEGNINVSSEGNYNLPPMMGWTAGVFEYAHDYLKTRFRRNAGT